MITSSHHQSFQSLGDVNRIMGYAMPSDFCQIFNNDLDHLYTLAFLLTGDREKAEQCFVAGLEDCLEGNPVFREWAQSWAKRAVVKNAIRVISPTRTGTISRCENVATIDAISVIDSPTAAAITKLLPFDRFVYVLSVLEKYSDRECAVLLGCTVEEIARTRTRAIHHLVSLITAPAVEGLAAD